MNPGSAGRVQGWVKLKQTLRNTYHKYLIPSTYSYRYMPAKRSMDFKHLTADKWLASQQSIKRKDLINYLALFLFAFGTTDFLYSSLYNYKESYYYYIENPNYMKKLENTIDSLNRIFKPVIDIQPKKIDDFADVGPKIRNLLFNTEKNEMLDQERAKQLRQQLKQIDAKLKQL